MEQEKFEFASHLMIVALIHNIQLNVFFELVFLYILLEC